MRVYIVGAGGLGREIASWILDCPCMAGSSLVGFLDTDASLPGVVGSDEDWCVTPEQAFVLAVNDPVVKARVVANLDSKGGIFLMPIHPSAIIARNATIGSGSVIGWNAVVSANARVGRFVTVIGAATIGHDAVVGDYSTICCHADITGGVVLEDGVMVGSHASILPGKQVGRRSIVGAGSVVVESIPAGVTAFGSPASVVWRH